MNLHAKLAPIVVREAHVRLKVIDAKHAVNPSRDPRSLGANHVIVPAILVDDRPQRLHVRLSHELVPPRFVVDAAVPRRLAEVALVAGHLGVVRHALRTNLKAGIDEAVRARQLDLQAHDEVRVIALRGQKLVLLHRLHIGTARQAAILHAPDLRVTFPAGEGFAVEHRLGILQRGRRFGRADRDDRETVETEDGPVFEQAVHDS